MIWWTAAGLLVPTLNIVSLPLPVEGEGNVIIPKHVYFGTKICLFVILIASSTTVFIILTLLYQIKESSNQNNVELKLKALKISKNWILSAMKANKRKFVKTIKLVYPNSNFEMLNKDLIIKVLYCIALKY